MNNNITSECRDGVLTITLSGRVDSSCATETEIAIDALREAPHETTVLDLEDLAYISSAGLRVILRLRKNEPTLSVENVSGEIYDIFEMTGFSEMMPISKAYRRLSVDGCEVIGQGANGKVYRLDSDTIIKVYMNPDSLSDIQRERELARKAFILGVPTAIPYDVVKVGDGYGSVFELLNAKSFAKLIAADPNNLDTYVGLYIDLLKKIHGTVVKADDMPDIREKAKKWLSAVCPILPPQYAEKLKALFAAIPEDMHMIHGDYHIKNVMMQNGEVLLIDMDTLCHGHPVFELGQMFNAYIGFSELDHSVSESFLGIPYEISVELFEKSLAGYLGDGANVESIRKKVMLVGYTRLLCRYIRLADSYGKSGEMSREVYKNHVIELLDEVDSLTF